MVEPLERWQWMRQPEVQSFGGSQEIYRLTESLYRKYYVPFLEYHRLEVESWKQFRRYCRPHGCYISLGVAHLYAKDDEPNVRVSSLDDVRPYPHLQFYALKVDSFDSPEAQQWGMLDDDEVYGYSIEGDRDKWVYQTWERARRRGFRFGSELCGRVVRADDGFAVALFDGPDQVGFLGRKCSVEPEPPWIYVTRRVARHIMQGCLIDLCRGASVR